jgi:hypothetical protein
MKHITHGTFTCSGETRRISIRKITIKFVKENKLYSGLLKGSL